MGLDDVSVSGLPDFSELGYKEFSEEGERRMFHLFLWAILA